MKPIKILHRDRLTGETYVPGKGWMDPEDFDEWYEQYQDGYDEACDRKYDSEKCGDTP